MQFHDFISRQLSRAITNYFCMDLSTAINVVVLSHSNSRAKMTKNSSRKAHLSSWNQRVFDIFPSEMMIGLSEELAFIYLFFLFFLIII